jgi:hypothetical protein
MSGRRLIRYLAVVSAVACLACGDSTRLTSPSPQKRVAPTSNVDATYSRYILISGVWTCVDGCDDDQRVNSVQGAGQLGQFPATSLDTR